MSETELFTTLGIENQTLDVIILTDRTDMPCRIGDMLSDRGYSWKNISLDRFITSQGSFRSAGTIIVDIDNVSKEERSRLIDAIKVAEENNTAAILVNNAIDFPVNDFHFASMLKTTSFDELQGRIDSNIRFKEGLSKKVSPPFDEIMTEQDRPLPDTIEQLKMAGRVQRDFLPSSLPDNEHVKWSTFFKPAEWVSGDIYDVARLDEQHIGFYLADAVGHSMPAALLTMFIKQTIKMRRTKGSDYQIFVPQEVIDKLNYRMTQQYLTGCLFATCFYGLLNIRTMQLTYCRAGHPYPILVRDGEPRQLESCGGLLGIFTDGEFEQKTIQLQKGDKLFVYSDGAESIIGGIETNKFAFTDSFKQILGMPVSQMMEAFKKLAAERDLDQAELDDMTAVALEIV